MEICMSHPILSYPIHKIYLGIATDPFNLCMLYYKFILKNDSCFKLLNLCLTYCMGWFGSIPLLIDRKAFGSWESLS